MLKVKMFRPILCCVRQHFNAAVNTGQYRELLVHALRGIWTGDLNVRSNFDGQRNNFAFALEYHILSTQVFWG